MMQVRRLAMALWNPNKRPDTLQGNVSGLVGLVIIL
jgi:hypothetical protein